MARSGKKSLNEKFQLALALLALAALGWLWWKSGRAGPRAEPSVQTAQGISKPVAQTNRSAPERTEGRPDSRLSAPKRTNTLAVKPEAASSSPPLPTVPVPEPTPARSEAGTGVPANMQTVLEAQVALVRQGISPGSLDGVLGSQTRAALNAYSRKEGRAFTSETNTLTQLHLSLSEPALANYTVTSNDLGRLLPLGKTWLSKSQQERLDFETILELVAEKAQAHPNLIRRLNPGVDWSNIVAGVTIRIPNTQFPPPRRAAFLKIFLEARALEAFDQDTNLLAHFPCSIAQRVEKRPVGELHVAVTAPNPNYTFDPEVFPESAEARELDRKLILQPGPNNPVGTAWIGLDKPGYGIHGTPRPEDVGRTESHGCFRLANWNAEYLLRLVAVGTAVIVEP